MDFKVILAEALKRRSADVFIVPGHDIAAKIGGAVTSLFPGSVSASDTESMIIDIYQTANRKIDKLLNTGDDDFSFSLPGLSRFRCNAYKQRGSLAAVLRVVAYGLPDPKELHVPDSVVKLGDMRRGMILVTGPAGSGKSTTLACIIDSVNSTQQGHIITIEDPIEFLHPHKRSIVSQREIEHDTEGYAQALRGALRQAPSVILLGEMRDYETIQTALTAAETGQLILSTLHTVGASQTIDRIIDVFPANRQQQVRIQLSMALRSVVSQQLVPDVSGGLVPAFEVMIVTPAIQNMIREGKVHQMDNVIFAGAGEGMRTMDGDLYNLYKAGRITKENALLFAVYPDAMRRKLQL